MIKKFHPNQSCKSGLLLLLFALLLLVLFLVDLLTGSVLIPVSSVADVFFSPGDTSDAIKTIVLEYRLPKAITALAAGAALSVSGLQMQTVFRNPLAGPYVLGISAGASLAVALFALGFSSFITGGIMSSWSLALVALTGSFLVMLLLLVVSARVNDNTTLLILGILFTSAAGAIVSILQYFSSEAMVKAFVVWTMGSLGNITSKQTAVIGPAVAAGIFIAFLKMKDLNAFLLGETFAQSVGVNINRSRLVVLFSASLLAGTITAYCGPIGFIGIAVPHLARVIFRTADHQLLIPAVLLIGADALLFSDIIAQLPGQKATLPINSVTALLGIPVLAWMIVRNKKFTAL